MVINMTTNNLQDYLDKFDTQFLDLEFIDKKWYQEQVGVVAFNSKASVKDSKGNFSEEYIRARFVWSLVNSGMYNKEYICVEFGFPKGNTKTRLKPDIVVFKNKDWLKDYEEAEKVKIFQKSEKTYLLFLKQRKIPKLWGAQ